MPITEKETVEKKFERRFGLSKTLSTLNIKLIELNIQNNFYVNSIFYIIDVGLKIKIKHGCTSIQQVLYSHNNTAIGCFFQLKNWSFRTVSFSVYNI